MPFRDASVHTLQPTFLSLGGSWHPLPVFKHKLVVVALVAMSVIVFSIGHMTAWARVLVA